MNQPIPRTHGDAGENGGLYCGNVHLDGLRVVDAGGDLPGVGRRRTFFVLAAFAFARAVVLPRDAVGGV